MATGPSPEHPEQPPQSAPRSAQPGPPSELLKPERLGSVAQLVVAVAVVLTICYLGRLVLITLLASVLLAYMLAPVVEGLERLRMPRSLAAFFAVSLLVGAMYGAVYFSYSRAVELADDLPRYTRKVRATVLHFRKQAQSIQKSTEELLPEEKEPGPMRVQQEVSWGDFISRTVGSVTEFIFIVSFIPFLVYFMLTWQEHVRAATVMLFRMENRNAAYVTLGKISAMIRSFIVGNVVIGFFLAVLSTVIFALLGLPYFYFVGVVSGFLSLVPYLGVVLALLPPVVASLGGEGGTGELLGVIITVLLLHLFALNVLYPKLLGKRLQLNPLVVTVALLVWGWIWGAMGLILAVPLAAAMKIIFDHIDRLRPYGAWMGE